MKTKLKKLNQLVLLYYAPTFKNTPTASLEVILNHRPLHFEFEVVGIRNYIRLKDEVNSKWPGYSDKNKYELGHLFHWKKETCKIDFQGGDISDYKSELLKVPLYNW